MAEVKATVVVDTNGQYRSSAEAPASTSNIKQSEESSLSIPSKDSCILPEEELLFKEFEAYTRSIHKAAASSTVNSLLQCVKDMQTTVDASREKYADLFSPAIQQFNQKINLSLSKYEKFVSDMDAQQKDSIRKTEILISSIENELHNMEKRQRNMIIYIGVFLSCLIIILRFI